MSATPFRKTHLTLFKGPRIKFCAREMWGGFSSSDWFQADDRFKTLSPPLLLPDYCLVFMTIYLRRFLTKRRDRQAIACRMFVSLHTILVYSRARCTEEADVDPNKICSHLRFADQVPLRSVSLLSQPLFILVNCALSGRWELGVAAH